MAGGVRLHVRLTPRGGQDRIDGLGEAGGRAVLRVRVASPPVDGTANAALILLIARRLGVAKSAVRIAAGQTGRVKTLEIAGESDVLEVRLTACAGGSDVA